ncbi:hypothetical protein MKX03_027887 [Papaver bracteatum]|nr:hypothetical protein MKX03_027887 [Papaver bracteatum]
MDTFRSQETMFLQAMDRSVDDREYSPKSSSPHFAFFNAAYTDKIFNFKWLASDHAQGEEIGVATTIGKMRDKDERGCLHFAAAGGSLEVCKYLIETLKLDVDPKDEHGHTPLYHASIKGRLKTVRYLLEKGANADAATDTNYTPLHCAAKIGNTKIMTLLLSRGARVDFASRTGTALQRAASRGHRGAVKVLLDHSANDTYLYLRAAYGTCLYLTKVKFYRLSFTMQPNVVTSQSMLRPLMSAILGKSWETMELLLQVTKFLNLLVAQCFIVYLNQGKFW